MQRKTIRFGITVTALTVAGVLGVTGFSGANRSGTNGATANIKDTAGTTLGTAELDQESSQVVVTVTAAGLTPGFHGFHIHTTGLCTNPDGSANFQLAGGHYAGDGGDHGEHAGDLPSLFVNSEGRAELRFTTGAFTVEELLAGDGSAIIIHAGRDNYANIGPRYVSNDPEQTGAEYTAHTGHEYTNGPDLETLQTGDAGGRTGCGVLERN